MGILLDSPKELSYRISYRRDLTALQLTPGAEATLLETRTRCRYRFSPEPNRRMRVAFWAESQETVVYDLIDGQVSNERPATPEETGAEIPEFIPVQLEASLRLNGELEAIHEPQGLSAYGQTMAEQALVTFVRPFFSTYSVEVVRVGSTWPARSYLSGELTTLLPGSRVRQLGNPAWILEASGPQNRLSYRGALRYDLGSQTVTANETGAAVLDAATGLIDTLEFSIVIASSSGAKIAPLVLAFEKL